MPRVVAMSKTDLFKNSLERTKGRISRNKLIEELNKVRNVLPHTQLVDYPHKPVTILNGFDWRDTSQGFEFWNGLYFGN